jgi:type VI secretion system secreted protein VgrG
MAESSAHDLKTTFIIKGLDKELHVVRFKGEEGLSIQYQFDLEVGCEDSNLAMDAIVGKEGCLTISGKEGERYVHGMVSRLQQGETKREGSWSFTFYHLTLVPKAWRLRHRTDCRIFQKKTVQQIVSGILDGAQIKHKFHSSGGEETRAREYCVQFRESDWSFVSRLLEEEGYFYYFVHDEQGHELQIGYNFQHHKDIPGEDVVPYHARDGLVAGQEFVFRFLYGQAIESGCVTLEDFNYEKPELELKIDARGSLDEKLEVYEYPGGYQSPEEGKRKAKLRLEALEATRRQGEGESTCPRLVAGHYFVLAGHERQELNHQKFLLTRIRHEAEPAGGGSVGEGVLEKATAYSNRFTCIPRAVPFRPLRLTPRPRITGVQTAIVQTETGEIDTRELAQVHVRFHWDRRGSTGTMLTCWIRVAQHWAGAAWGSLYLPRKGQEVIVEFEDGDPDRPIITGCVYNGLNVPPYLLPRDQTKSTLMSQTSPGGGGFNEIRFEDKKGQEELFTHAQKDQNEIVRGNQSTTVGGKRGLAIKGDHVEEVKGESAHRVVGDRTVKTEASYQLEAAASIKEQAGANVTVNAGGYLLAQAGGNAALVGTATLVKGSEVVVIKGLKIVLDAEKILIKGGLVQILGKPVLVNCGPGTYDGVDVDGEGPSSGASGAGASDRASRRGQGSGGAASGGGGIASGGGSASGGGGIASGGGAASGGGGIASGGASSSGGGSAGSGAASGGGGIGGGAAPSK